MTIEPEHITPRMQAMLRRAGRAELIATGFVLDDTTFDRSRALSRHDLDHAIVHALFDRSAPHASAINPPAPAAVTPQVATEPARSEEVPLIVALSDANADREFVAEACARATLQRWIHIAILTVIALTLLVATARAQPSAPILMGAKASGNVVTGSQRQSGPYYIDCGAGTTFSLVTSTLTCPGTGGGTSLPNTSNLFKGNGNGGALAATPGTDYVIPSGNAATATALAGAISRRQRYYTVSVNTNGGANPIGAWLFDASCCFVQGLASTTTVSSGLLIQQGASHYAVLQYQIPDTWSGTSITVGAGWALAAGGATTQSGSHSYAVACFTTGTSSYGTALTYGAARTAAFSFTGTQYLQGQYDVTSLTLPTSPACHAGDTAFIQMIRVNTGTNSTDTSLWYFDVTAPYTVP